MDLVTTASLLGPRRAAIMFAAAGSLSIVNAWLPGVCPADQRAAFTLLGLLDACVAVAFLRLPWHRWPAWTLAAVPVSALALVDLFAIVGRLEPGVYSLFLLLLGIWTGLSLPRWTTLKLTPAIAAAFVLPLVVRDRGADALDLVGLVVPLVVLVGELVGHVVSGLHAANAQLAEAALRDDLTGIGNRRHAMDALSRVRPGDAVLILDVDHFKQINDHLGHASGDAVLAALGALLRRTTRGADAIARLGGEEFLILLSDAGADATCVANRILEDWRATEPVATLSIGIATVEPGEAPDDALARADAALYAAKARGRDRAELAAAAPVAG